MTREEILEQLKTLLIKDEYVVLKEQIAELSETTSLLDDLALDSLQILNLIVLIEESFGFVSESEELNLDMFDNVSLLIDFIHRKLSVTI